MNLHVKMPGARPTKFSWHRIVQQLRRARGPAIAALLVASLTALALSLWQLSEINRQNSLIAALQSGEDTGAKSGGDEVRLARASFLISQDRFEEAQAVIDAAKPTASPRIMSRLLYNQANANVRRAFAAIEGSKHDAAIPLTKLAKDAYREALRLDPMAWNAKFNYDVATRLMRDFPGYEQEGEETPPEADVKLWTDLPGVPQGSP